MRNLRKEVEERVHEETTVLGKAMKKAAVKKSIPYSPSYTINDEKHFINNIGTFKTRPSETPKLVLLVKYRDVLNKRVRWDALNEESVKAYVEQAIEKERGKRK